MKSVKGQQLHEGHHLHPYHELGLVVDGDAACGIYRQRAVVDIVPPSVAEGACRKGLLSFAAVEFQRRRSGNELRFGPLVPDECEVSGHRGGAADAVLPNVVVHGRFGGDDEICIDWRGGCEGQDNGVLFLLRERELFGIGLYVGLDGGHRHPLSGRLLPAPEEDERQEDGKRRPGRFAQPPHFPAGCQRPEYQQVGDQYPKRTAESTRKFVPLYRPCIVGEAVAQQQPWERDLPVEVNVLRRYPSAYEQDVGECGAAALARVVVEHENCAEKHYLYCRGGEDADGGRVPYPPYRGDRPEAEGERRPARHTPERPARGVVAVADEKQRDEGREQRKSADAEPPDR